MLAARGTAAALAALLLAAGCGGAAPPAAPSTASTSAAAPASPAPSASAGGFRSVRTYRAVAAPERLRIPSLGVDTSLERVGLAEDGTIAPPDGWHTAGWYTGGPRPGQDGPAVVVGHVDSRSGPAVFYRLPELKRGAVVSVEREDGSRVEFRVTGQRRVPKDAFPAAEVYAPTLRASLLLITCGGEFDASTGHYVDNVLVTAVPR